MRDEKVFFNFPLRAKAAPRTFNKKIVQSTQLFYLRATFVCAKQRFKSNIAQFSTLVSRLCTLQKKKLQYE